VLGDCASAFGHPFVAGTGYGNRDHAPYRRIEDEPASLLWDLSACRRKHAQTDDVCLSLDLKVLDRQVTREFLDLPCVFRDERRNMIAGPVSVALADKPPQRVRRLALLKVLESRVTKDDRLGQLVRLFLIRL
jgi:hypothetical protein